MKPSIDDRKNTLSVRTIVVCREYPLTKEKNSIYLLEVCFNGVEYMQEMSEMQIFYRFLQIYMKAGGKFMASQSTFSMVKNSSTSFLLVAKYWYWM